MDVAKTIPIYFDEMSDLIIPTLIDSRMVKRSNYIFKMGHFARWVLSSIGGFTGSYLGPNILMIKMKKLPVNWFPSQSIN